MVTGEGRPYRGESKSQGPGETRLASQGEASEAQWGQRPARPASSDSGWALL